MTTEKAITREFLLLYKDFPCLWDNRQVLYSNKEARDQAYEVLLEKYKQIMDDATIIDVKRRIENMRTTYRREHKKVLLSRINNDGEEYVPTLWYYDYMTFLNDVSSFSNLETTPKENEEDKIKTEYVGSTPKPKRKRPSAVSTIYLPERQDSDDDGDEDKYFEMHEDSITIQDKENSVTSAISQDISANEPEAFGTVIGLQLKELDSMQRAIAEKLISEVIFLGRMSKLTINTIINNNKF